MWCKAGNHKYMCHICAKGILDSNFKVWVCHKYENVHFRAYFGPIYARVKGHLEPTHLKFSPLFTFSTKLLGQDSPSIHLFSKIIGSRFTNAKMKLGEDSPS